MNTMNLQTVYIDQDEVMYVDSDFLNGCQNAVEHSELKHYGYGEFYLLTPQGIIHFERRDGMEFEGMSGRCHKMYDNCNGLAISNLLEKMLEKMTLKNDFKKVISKK